MFSQTNVRLLGWILFLCIGFLVGISWKSREAKVDPPFSAATVSNNSSASTSKEVNLMKSEKATIALFENAAPSVCFITTSNVRRDFFTMNISEIPRGTGSGFVWDDEGHIVTNYHVIQGADKAQVTLADRSTWPAKLVGKAPEKDLAVLKIEKPAKELRPLPIGTSEDLKVGQAVYAIGNPFGLDQTLTTGVVSALGREINSVADIPIRDVIQTDAAINPGNSGGPLLNSSGQLIGVNTAIYSPSGASAGIGFSIPVDAVSWVVPELITYGKIKRPSLGVELARPNILQRLGIQGALVIDVIRGSGADRAGIQPTYRDRSGAIQLGDIIVQMDDEVIQNNNDLFLALESYQAGGVVLLKILRGDRGLEVEVELDPPR